MGWLVSVHLVQKTSGDPLQKVNQSRISKAIGLFFFSCPITKCADQAKPRMPGSPTVKFPSPIKSMPGSNQNSPHRHSWIAKFARGFRGIAIGIAGQSSFVVHIFAASTVLIVGWVLEISRTEWCLLILCIALVMAAELFNSALEQLAKAITKEEDPHVRNGLDIASGAVLVAAIGAAVIGLLVLGSQALQ